MNDTENRLRDYLHTQATNAVPADAQGPGLDEPTKARHWPVLLSAAAVVLVLGLAATFLTHRGSGNAEPAGRPANVYTPTNVYAPPGALTADLPKVPYTITKNNVTTLYDDGQAVRLPDGVETYSTRRVDGGWLVQRSGGAGDFTAGVLLQNGTFRQVGPKRADMPVLSPDRTQVAVVHSITGTDQGQVLVLDLRTGRELSHTAVGSVPLLRGWNKDGIWFSNGEHDSPPTNGTLYVWRPGSGEPQRLSVPGYSGSIAVPAEPGNVVVTTGTMGHECLVAGSLSDGRFVQQRKFCSTSTSAVYPVLAPDGKTMLDTGANQAVDLGTGKTTKFQLPDPIMTWPEPVFEDTEHVLLPTERQPKGGHGEIFQQLFRCDVTSGACKLVMKDGRDVTLSKP